VTPVEAPHCSQPRSLTAASVDFPDGGAVCAKAAADNVAQTAKAMANRIIGPSPF
jgi:hypothetical protein